MFNGQHLTGRNQPSIELIQAILSLLPPGSAIGQSQCGPMPSSLAKELQAHHIQIIVDSCGQVYIQVP
jgi:phospholipid N-methyltransferase